MSAKFVNREPLDFGAGYLFKETWKRFIWIKQESAWQEPYCDTFDNGGTKKEIFFHKWIDTRN